MILLFSSDYYPVYKRDVFAVSSLPVGYCYHFRYQEEYVSDKLKKNLQQIENSMGLVIFVAGNKGPGSVFKFLPVRRVKIVKTYFEPQTKLYHVYFELDSFIELIDDVSSFDEIPETQPGKKSIYFGTTVAEPKYKISAWSDVVRTLSSYSNGLFFHIHFENEYGITLRPTYDPQTYDSFFKIIEGNSYLVKISIADFNQNKNENEIKTKIEGTDIKSNIGESINSGLDKDDRVYKLTGLVLGDLTSSVNLLKISTSTQIATKTSDDYSVRLLFHVEKDPKRFWTYFWYSIFVFLGGALITVDFSKIVTASVALISIKAVGLIITSLAAASLFARFNKK